MFDGVQNVQFSDYGRGAGAGAGELSKCILSRVYCNVVSGAERPSWPSILVITPVFFIRPTLINIRAVTGL